MWRRCLSRGVATYSKRCSSGDYLRPLLNNSSTRFFSGGSSQVGFFPFESLQLFSSFFYLISDQDWFFFSFDSLSARNLKFTVDFVFFSLCLTLWSGRLLSERTECRRLRVYSSWPLVWCSGRRGWRSWAQSCNWTIWAWIQYCLHYQALPYSFAYSCSSGYSRSPILGVNFYGFFFFIQD